ncbi:hypothetical protein NEMBOFW57_001477 [Staphylotrichum longicolle]|uniref:Uncharacterized protein n=1 Tax=Staphylotrichum longicolle TaxID=669026 RepID=A0AAD4F650_9PEZI|nr:hypothetical protein NEMBOFW57_001477 [Staphylotrichum longicolle]
MSQYGHPQGGYPPPQGYGAPPPQGYGAPPPQGYAQGYPPQQPGYGPGYPPQHEMQYTPGPAPKEEKSHGCLYSW